MGAYLDLKEVLLNCHDITEISLKVALNTVTPLSDL
jgi:hypothetical protein